MIAVAETADGAMQEAEISVENMNSEATSRICQAGGLMSLTVVSSNSDLNENSTQYLVLALVTR